MIGTPAATNMAGHGKRTGVKLIAEMTRPHSSSTLGLALDALRRLHVAASDRGLGVNPRLPHEMQNAPPTSSWLALETPLTLARQGSDRNPSGEHDGGYGTIGDHTAATATGIFQHQPYTYRKGAWRGCSAREGPLRRGRGEAA